MPVPGAGCRVQGVGGAGCRVQGVSEVQGGYMVQGAGCRVQGEQGVQWVSGVQTLQRFREVQVGSGRFSEVHGGSIHAGGLNRSTRAVELVLAVEASPVPRDHPGGGVAHLVHQGVPQPVRRVDHLGG